MSASCQIRAVPYYSISESSSNPWREINGERTAAEEEAKITDREIRSGLKGQVGGSRRAIVPGALRTQSIIVLQGHICKELQVSGSLLMGHPAGANYNRGEEWR
ncbi:hypothetical protein GDO78_017711 [Eleutherodactylus coqui]|uniref:Uncharacterized protein n=1 Tax=Eleutherodactylus coqui TaxID=57060 RepID=A0A8J6BIQ1_ELECQ|nr:hypothetical protein GDO78_017711 [Eleutherodactylus coqui]